MEVYKTSIVPFDIELINKKYEKKIKYDFSIRSTSARRNRSAQTSKIYNYYTYYLYSATGETGLTGGTRVSVTT